MVGFDFSKFKTNKRQKITAIIYAVFMVALLMSIVLCCMYKGNLQEISNNNLMQNNSNLLQSQIDKTQSEPTVNIGAKSSFAVMEGGRNILLHSQNATTRLPMASTTKIMTAYIACTSGKLNDIVTVPKAAVGVEGSSIYLKEGEKYKLIDLVYGLMLRSGNDAAETIAYDLAYITCEALKNQDFANICSAKSHKFQMSTGEHKCYVNKNKLLNLYDDCIGVKTGYTKKAGRCLVSAAKRNGVTIVSVVLNQYDMWNLSMANLNKGFEQSQGVLLAKSGEVFAKIKTPNGECLNLGFINDIYYSALKNEKLNISYDITINKNLPNSVKNGEIVGEIKFFNDKHLLFTEKIYTI